MFTFYSNLIESFSFFIYQAISFLFQYNYLNKTTSDDSAGATNLNDPRVIEAISNVQRFGNLGVTGKLDSETLKLINTSRCGREDPVHKLNKKSDSLGQLKVGRYYLQGSYWRKKVNYKLCLELSRTILFL